MLVIERSWSWMEEVAEIGDVVLKAPFVFGSRISLYKYQAGLGLHGAGRLKNSILSENVYHLLNRMHESFSST